MPYESSMQTKWADVATEEVDEVKIPAFLFVLCKSVTEDSSGGIHLNGTIVQRTLWEGDPPEPAENDVPYFKVDFKGVLPGGDVEERRHETKDLDNGIKMVYATINFKAAPIDVQASWSGFPFRIFKGTVELELQAKLVGGKMLCPDLCTLTTKGQKPINDVIHKLVRVKDHMSRCRSLAFVKPRPVIEICGDRRMKSKPTCPDDTFTTYPQIRLTFWLHEPTSKAVFEIFGPLLLVLVLMLVNFEQTFGFDTIDDWLEDDAVNDHSDYLANVISIGIAAVVVVPNIRRTSVISSVHSCTPDDGVAVLFVFGLALSAWPHPMVACVGCALSCLVVFLSIVNFVVYWIVRKNIINRKLRDPVRVISPEKTKSFAGNFKTDVWERAGITDAGAGTGAAAGAGAGTAAGTAAGAGAGAAAGAAGGTGVGPAAGTGAGPPAAPAPAAGTGAGIGAGTGLGPGPGPVPGAAGAPALTPAPTSAPAPAPAPISTTY
eukprot:g20470.t1